MSEEKHTCKYCPACFDERFRVRLLERRLASTNGSFWDGLLTTMFYAILVMFLLDWSTSVEKRLQELGKPSLNLLERIQKEWSK